MRRLVLASASPRREALLRQVGADFVALPVEVDETIVDESIPAGAVLDLAERKAAEGARQAIAAGLHQKGCTGAIVVAADTIVVSPRGAIYGKPKNEKDACRMLRGLAGKTHQVYTGVALASVNADDTQAVWLEGARCDEREGILVSDYTATAVKFAQISRRDIEWYVGTGEPLGKAGAYALQGVGARFVEYVWGSDSGVIGLPLQLLSKMLAGLRYDISRGDAAVTATAAAVADAGAAADAAAASVSVTADAVKAQGSRGRA